MENEGIKKRLAHLEGQITVVEHIYKAIETHNNSINDLKSGVGILTEKVDNMDGILSNGIVGKVNTAISYIENKINNETRREKRKAVFIGSLLTALFTGLVTLAVTHHEEIILYFFGV